MTKFKVGDKVRIISQVDADCTDSAKIGGEAEITGGFDCGHYPVRYETDYGGFIGGWITPGSIELINAKPTKKQRISALESEVSALKAELEALKQAQVRTDVDKIADRLAELIVDEPVLTPNELRKAIIAEARAFVAENKKQASGVAAPSMPGAGTRMTFQDVYSMNYYGTKAVCKAEFFVNPDKRTVTVLLKGVVTDKLYAKGIAKCAPTDVFNADIGKAIALGRALGLDVSKFEQAVQPTEVVVGQVVNNTFEHAELFGWGVGKVTRIDGEGYHVTDDSWSFMDTAVIIDDTEAQYE